MLTRAFLLGCLAVVLPAGAVALVAEGGGDDVSPSPPVNTVQGAPATIGPSALGGVTPRPLVPTPPSTPDYEMSTRAGNALVATLVKRVIVRLRAKKLTTPAGVSTALGTGMARIAKQGFEEVYESPVREAIGNALDRPLVRAGINPDAIIIG